MTSPKWEPWEDKIVQSIGPKEAARRLDHRTYWAVRKRRADLKNGEPTYVICDCGSYESKVINTIGAVRIRRCLNCHSLIKTVEEVMKCLPYRKATLFNSRKG